MSRASLLAVLVVVTGTAAALADATVTFSDEGYDDFFKRCDLGIETTKSDAIAGSAVIYRVTAGDKGALVCEKEDYGSACRGELEEYTCEDVTAIDLYALVCRDGDGGLMSCGTVAAKAGKGMSGKVSAVPAPPKADTTIYGSLAGYDDFFDRCDFGFMYASGPEVARVELEFDVVHAGGAASCSWSLSGSSGTGSSCQGNDEFACDAVQSLNVTKVTCQDGDNEIDCGSVAFGAVEDGLITDAR